MRALSMILIYCRTIVGTRAADQRGASVLEYALLASLIAVVCIGAITIVGTSTATNLSDTASQLP